VVDLTPHQYILKSGLIASCIIKREPAGAFLRVLDLKIATCFVYSARRYRYSPVARLFIIIKKRHIYDTTEHFRRASILSGNTHSLYMQFTSKINDGRLAGCLILWRIRIPPLQTCLQVLKYSTSNQPRAKLRPHYCSHESISLVYRWGPGTVALRACRPCCACWLSSTAQCRSHFVPTHDGNQREWVGPCCWRRSRSIPTRQSGNRGTGHWLHL